VRYYIADLHFFHAAQNQQMDCRGFANLEQMHEYMIMKWNRKVQKNDEVVIIGDFSFGNSEETISLLHRLNGKLFLIQGNHDKFLNTQSTHCFQWVKPYAELSDNKRRVILCHYPIICYNKQYRVDENGNPKTYMLYGHVHNTMDQRLIEQFQLITRQTITTDAQGNTRTIPCNMINCFCMYSDYEPLTLDEWIACDRKRRKEVL
jgi:Predicted phosphoesterase or phosphohydrolase